MSFWKCLLLKSSQPWPDL